MVPGDPGRARAAQRSGGRARGRPGLRTGWSSIAIASAYPQARVDGIDSDAASIDAARANAAADGLEDRVRFLVRDAGDPRLEGATTW